jgi:YHS domain-containing protein
MKTLKFLGSMIVVGAICAGTLVAFAADTAKPAEKLKPYPLTFCVVSGDKLGEMGSPVVTNYNGQEIKFCCKDCVKDFDKDPAKYIKKIEAEAAKAAKK